MLHKRLASAFVIILILVTLCWLDYRVNFGRPGVWLLPVGILIGAASTAELLRLLAARNLRPIPWVVYAGVAMMLAAACLPVLWKGPLTAGEFLVWPILAFVSATMLAFFAEMRRFQRPGTAVVDLALAILAISYLGVFFCFMVGLRGYVGNEWGMVALLSLIAVVKLSDICAYTVGRLIGRHRMVPVLSPGKTLEGAAAGIVAACFASWFVLTILPNLIMTDPPESPSWWRWATYGIVVGAAGIMGDLSESLIKRDMQDKDSGTSIPGMGGMLDLLDSILFAAPVAYMCWAGGLVGP